MYLHLHEYIMFTILYLMVVYKITPINITSLYEIELL